MSALTVTCSLCHAKPGQICKTVGLGAARGEPHEEREAWARQVGATAPDPAQISLGAL